MSNVYWPSLLFRSNDLCLFRSKTGYHADDDDLSGQFMERGFNESAYIARLRLGEVYLAAGCFQD